MAVGWLLGLLLFVSTAVAYPEYKAELPNIPSVNGSPWTGVGHLNRGGGGLRNQFGKDFAAAGYSWTQALCRLDSDGDGHSNGKELGDPHCKWQKGQPHPEPTTTTISHPGLKQSVPQLLTANKFKDHTHTKAVTMHAATAPAPAAASGAAATTTSSSNSSSSSGQYEPNADMAIPQGSERNLNGDKPQRWCEARRAAAAGSSDTAAAAGDGGSSGSSGSSEVVGSNQDWLNITLPEMTVLGTPDMYSCHTIRIPDNIPDAREFVGVAVGLDGASHLHHILLMDCPGDLWFLGDVTRNSEMCTTHAGSMFAACNRWWIATEANNDYHMCTPPGLIYARAGEMRAHNKALVLQVHWVFGAKLLNKSVTLTNASINLMHEDPPAGPSTHIMETIEGTAIYPPSMLQHVNGLVIPGGRESYTADYSCAKRCTYVPLGGLMGKPVTIAGYTFHAHHFLTGMTMRIKRCPLTRLPDVTWQVTDWQQSVVHPTYDVTGQGIQLYPGDTLSWSCTFNTSATNRTVYGGYAGYSEEMCIMLLHYYPRNSLLRGCMAVTPQQGGHSLCMFEGAQILQWQSAEATRVPVRTVLSPRSLPPGRGQPQGLNPGYKASVIIFWLLTLTAFLWGVSFLLRQCSFLGLAHRAYTSAEPAVQRNIPVYIMHLLIDTIVLALWFPTLFAGWCGCTEAGPSHSWSLGLYLMYIVVAYALELVWRSRIDTMLATHHIATILIISFLLGELSADLYQYADVVILLGFFAVLEQPTFVALLLQRLLPPGSVHTARSWRVAVGFWFGSKTLSAVMAVWLIARDWSIMPGWVRGMYIGIWCFVYAIQVWSGIIQMSIMRSAVGRHRKRQLVGWLPDADSAICASDDDRGWSSRDSSIGELELQGLTAAVVDIRDGLEMRKGKAV